MAQFSDEQQHQIDSLNEVIANPNSHDTSLAGAYISLSEILAVSNLDTVIPLCEKTKKIAEGALNDNPPAQIKKSLLKSLTAAFSGFGYIYEIKGDLPKALDYYHMGLKNSKEIGDKEGVAYNLVSIGGVYDSQGDISKSLECYHKSLKIFEEIGDKYGMGSTLNNIGYIYNNQGQFKEAIDYFQRSLKIQEESGDKQGLAGILNNIGSIYDSQGDISKALEYYHKGLKIREEINDKLGIAYSMENIGRVYYHQDNIPKALECFDKGLKIREEIGDKAGIAKSLNKIGFIELQKGGDSGIATAKQHFLRSLELAEELGYPNIISNSSHNLSKVYEKQGQGMKALEMYKLYTEMKDSLNNEATQKASVQQKVKYEYEKQKVLDDAEHDKLFAVEQEEKEKQQILTGATAGGLGLVVVFLIFVFNRLRITKKQKLVIEEQKQEVEQQKEVVETAHHELEEKNQEIMDSIAYAKRIQSAILPPAKVVKEYLKESFILFKPKDVVAGDFYWMELKDNKVLFAAADCTGHGVPGAMVSVVCNNGLNRSVREYGLTDPGQILDKTREIVIQEFEKSEEEVKDGMDIALCSLEGNKLQYAGAHNPLWIIRNGELIETKASKQPIGQFDNPEPYTTHSFDLEAGDSLYIFSDGYVDQFGGEKGKKFKSKAFRELLLSIQDKSMEEQKTIIDDSFETWKGSLEQIDDVCVIGVRV